MPFRYLYTFLVFLLASANCGFADELSAKAHNELFDKEKFPSAKQCANCHIEHFKEWSVSPHAYAQISPVFNAMHAATVKRTNGTTGDFCIRCHTPVGMQLSEPVFMSNLDRHEVSNEGVTCVTCHRRDKPVGKSSGRFGLIEGDIFDTVYGPHTGEELERVIKSGEYDVNTDPKKQGRNIHAKAEKFDQLTTSGYCGSCHDVNSATGFRLEEAFSEYKAGPAAAKGISCQDCHMGKEPGKNSGYDERAIAIVGGKPTRPRKKTNHMFVGPDYSIVHPGIYPHNLSAAEMASHRDWIAFDYKSGWGTDEFEDKVKEVDRFPERWKSVADRFEARKIIEENLELLNKASEERMKLLRNGYQLGEVAIKEANESFVSLNVEFKNATEGHNVPTGFDAERVVFLRVQIKDSEDRLVFVSGDLDPNGDLRDGHSAYVRNGEISRDKQLFSLQSKFIVNMIRGGDREEVLPINNSLSPLPFVRPPTSAT
ncbi:MAG: cytochrome C, partial [Proteobacteria bacterium]|nr:cytochrome C [Pseudomonadota bacterium]